MKNTCAAWALGLLLIITLISCSSDDGPNLTGTNISISDIQGNWTATSAVFTFRGTGPGQRNEVVRDGGSVSLNIQGNGRFTLTIAVAGRSSSDTFTGQLGFDEDLLTVSYDDDPDEFDFFGIQTTATTLSINGPAEFDFDADGQDEPALAELDFVRA